VVAVLAPTDACDRVEASAGMPSIRVGPREVLLVGEADVSSLRATVGEGSVVEDVSDAWVALVIEGADARDAFASLSELALPAKGWIQGEVARTGAKVLAGPAAVTILVPAMLAVHVERRIRVDAAEVLSS
jgi:sarcosine oxidase gamma subunit